jgi:hypothetical protein
MPRDLASLVKGDADGETAPSEGVMFGAMAANNKPEDNSKRDEVHPYTQTLTLSDVDSCVILEDLAFPPNERASRAKVSLKFSSPSVPLHFRPLGVSSPHHPRPSYLSLSPSLQHLGVTHPPACAGLSLLALHSLGLKWDPTHDPSGTRT